MHLSNPRMIALVTLGLGIECVRANGRQRRPTRLDREVDQIKAAKDFSKMRAWAN